MKTGLVHSSARSRVIYLFALELKRANRKEVGVEKWNPRCWLDRVLRQQTRGKSSTESFALRKLFLAINNNETRAFVFRALGDENSGFETGSLQSAQRDKNDNEKREKQRNARQRRPVWR